jgi:hypothetical protein
MPDLDLRALCAELVDDLEEWVDGYLINDPPDEHTVASFERISRTRVALSQPAPEPPMDEALLNHYNRVIAKYIDSITSKRKLIDSDLSDSVLAGLRAIYNWGQGNA